MVEVQKEEGHWFLSGIKDSEVDSPLESWVSLTLRRVTCSSENAADKVLVMQESEADKKEHTRKRLCRV